MIVYIKMLLTALFWGGTFIAGKAVAQDVGPFSASFLRFVVASFFLFCFTFKAEGKFPAIRRGQVIPVILLGMTGIFSYNVFFFKGLKLIDAGRASLIIANCPIFITLFSVYIFKEKLSLVKIAGIMLSVTGAMIVISKGSLLEIFNGNIGWGEAYIFICVLCWAAFSLIGKKVMTDLSPLASISYASAAGAIALFFPAYFEGMTNDLVHYTIPDWIGIFYLGFFGTVLGFVWYYEGIQKLGPMKAGIFINFVPVCAIILAFFILNEPVTISLVIGAFFVGSGVYLTNSYKKEAIRIPSCTPLHKQNE